MTEKEANTLFQSGRYSEAANLMRSVLAKRPNPPDSEIFLYARSLVAQSRYDEAFNLLLLTATSPEGAARAYGLQAELRWIQHRYEEAHKLCLRSLGLNLFNARVQLIRDRCRTALKGDGAPTVVPGADGGRRLGHGAFYVAPGGNFGDLALPPTVRATVERWKPVAAWEAFHVHQQFDADCVRRANALDGLVIGGGGLFLPDTGPNGDSGWQWNVANENLRRIDAPIYVLAVGYNLFEGQSFSGGTFARSLRTLVERAEIVGLRNHGSIDRVRALLPDALADRISYMPCPTTVLDRLDVGPLDAVDVEAARKRVFLNAAFDRSDRRFGGGYAGFLDQVARYVTALLADGVSVEFAAHLPKDEKLADDLADRYGLGIPIHGLYDMDCLDGYNLYRKAGLVVGMRGHATMIPFGLGVPVLSIVSHPKMRFFLEDIGRPEWGVSAGDPELAARLYEKTVDCLDRSEAVRGEISGMKDRLHERCAETIGRMA